MSSFRPQRCRRRRRPRPGPRWGWPFWCHWSTIRNRLSPKQPWPGCRPSPPLTACSREDARPHRGCSPLRHDQVAPGRQGSVPRQRQIQRGEFGGRTHQGTNRPWRGRDRDGLEGDRQVGRRALLPIHPMTTSQRGRRGRRDNPGSIASACGRAVVIPLKVGTCTGADRRSSRSGSAGSSAPRRSANRVAPCPSFPRPPTVVEPRVRKAESPLSPGQVAAARRFHSFAIRQRLGLVNPQHRCSPGQPKCAMPPAVHRDLSGRNRWARIAGPSSACGRYRSFRTVGLVPITSFTAWPMLAHGSILPEGPSPATGWHLPPPWAAVAAIMSKPNRPSCARSCRHPRRSCYPTIRRGGP